MAKRALLSYAGLFSFQCIRSATSDRLMLNTRVTRPSARQTMRVARCAMDEPLRAAITAEAPAAATAATVAGEGTSNVPVSISTALGARTNDSAIATRLTAALDRFATAWFANGLRSNAEIRFSITCFDAPRNDSTSLTVRNG